jgi:hypothetical protein
MLLSSDDKIVLVPDRAHQRSRVPLDDCKECVAIAVRARCSFATKADVMQECPSTLDQDASHRVRIGPAGWSYPDGEGQVYPTPTPRGFDPLVYLAQSFDTIEIIEVCVKKRTGIPSGA